MLTEQNVNKQLRINAIIKGLILGVILLASSIFSYYLITAITKTAWLIIAGPYFFAIIIPIIITAFFCMDMRKKLGGYWDFRQAVTAVFIMFLVCYAVLTIGRDLVFAKFIEPNMVQNTEAVMLNVRAESLKIAGAGQDEINKQVIELRKEFELQKDSGVGAIIQGFTMNFIMLFVGSLIFGAIFKKVPPYTLQVDKDVDE